MKLRTFALGTAAALLLAAPALAQQSYYDTNPTPAERAQTNQLNSNAASQAQSDADANATANGNYNAARDTYDRNRADYDAQRAAYDRERARYQADRHGYGHRWDAFYGYARFHDVVGMRSRDLVGLTVNTRGGNRVGRIRDIDVNSDGRVSRVAVSYRDRVAWIDADDLRYDPETRVVLTDLSRDQIDGMARMRYPRF